MLGWSSFGSASCCEKSPGCNSPHDWRVILAMNLTTFVAYTVSGVARPGPTRACALPSTSQALPSPTQLESRDFTTNQTKVKKYIFILLC